MWSRSGRPAARASAGGRPHLRAPELRRARLHVFSRFGCEPTVRGRKGASTYPCSEVRHLNPVGGLVFKIRAIRACLRIGSFLHLASDAVPGQAFGAVVGAQERVQRRVIPPKRSGDCRPDFSGSPVQGRRGLAPVPGGGQ